MNIKKRIIYSTVIISWLLIASSIWCLISKTNQLGQELLFTIQKDRLTSIRYFKTIEVETYFENLMENTSTLAANHILISAFQDFAKSFPEYLSEAIHIDTGYKSEVVDGYLNDFTKKYEYFNTGKTIDPKKFINLMSENSFALQYNYIFNNPYYLTDKEKLQSVDDGTTYSLMHKKYHPLLSAFKKQFGFYDILLVDIKRGDIIYSVNKEIDFTTSLTNGAYSKSSISEVFRKVVTNKQANFIAIADFAPYLAFYDNPAAFIGVGIFDTLGNKIGVMIVQLSIDKINDIMLNKAQWPKIGLGSTINSSIIGSDYKLRTSNRFFVENREKFLNELREANIEQDVIDLIKAKNSIIGILKTDTLAVRQAFNGQEGFSEYLDYRNTPVISSFSPLKIPGLNWAIVVKMEKQEALNWLVKLKAQIIYTGIMIGGIFGILAILLGLGVTKSIVAYIYEITDQINNIAKAKDLTKSLTVPKDSEFSVMINAFNNFINNLQGYLKDILIIAKQSDRSDKKDITDRDNMQDELRDRIYDLSKEFKIIADQEERTKYW